SLGYGFDGFASPIPKSQWGRGRTIPVKFALVDRSGAAVAPAAGVVAARVRLWSSSTGGSLAEAPCGYDGELAQYVCNLKVPSGLTSGRSYWVVAEVRVGSGPWVVPVPVAGARTSNPVPIRVR
ncbi:MAG TPA: hypothetical protein VFO65_00370, partial [Acidimicrobiales bacterium]|nr:hypothetical protein [Acidimicrobiales bacterium]